MGQNNFSIMIRNAKYVNWFVYSTVFERPKIELNATKLLFIDQSGLDRNIVSSL